MIMLSDIFSLIYQAMTVNFSVFGFTINLWQFFVFSIFMSLFVMIWRYFINW